MSSIKVSFSTVYIVGVSSLIILFAVLIPLLYMADAPPLSFIFMGASIILLCVSIFLFSLSLILKEM